MTTTTLEGGTYRLVREHDKGEERHWSACRAYSAEVASATKAGSSGPDPAAFFNTPYEGRSHKPSVTPPDRRDFRTRNGKLQISVPPCKERLLLRHPGQVR
jgi:hypothetical protein